MARSNWLLEVLEDLKKFADLNGLPKLGDQINRARATAQLEIAAKEQAHLFNQVNRAPQER